jgi:hypothetical protein
MRGEPSWIVSLSTRMNCVAYFQVYGEASSIFFWALSVFEGAGSIFSRLVAFVKRVSKATLLPTGTL